MKQTDKRGAPSKLIEANLLLCKCPTIFVKAKDFLHMVAGRVFTLPSWRSIVIATSLTLSSVGMSFGEANRNSTEMHPLDLAKLVQTIPFSFEYDGQSSSAFISSWKVTVSSDKSAPSAVQNTFTYSDPAGALEVQYQLTSYRALDAAEWIVTFRNIGRRDTQIIGRIRPLDVHCGLRSTQQLVVHYAYGSRAKAWAAREGHFTDYMPQDRALKAGGSVRISHYTFENGDHKDSYLPFFNLQWGSGGFAGAIGWTGQWSLDVQRAPESLTVDAGQQTTHFVLHPGEAVRTPRILLLEYKGRDWIQGQNSFRNLLIAHYLPRIHDSVRFPPVANTGAYVETFDDIAKKTGQNPFKVLPRLQNSDLLSGKKYISHTESLNYVTEQNQLDQIRGLPDIGLEAYWIDAGWFVGGWPNGRGNWVPKQSFPSGLKPISDAAHAKGLKFVLWYDPEAVAADSIIAREHPTWVLYKSSPAKPGDLGIFLFSDPKAVEWMTELISKEIRDWGVDIFRLDRNINPVPYWNAADQPNRKGITETKQIEGFYKFLDNLLQRFPDLEIDNANWRVTGPDLEMMKRSIGSLTRSEEDGPGVPHPAEQQATTQEITLWVPLSTTMLHGSTLYDFRSAATTGLSIASDLSSKYISAATLRQGITELKELRPYWLGDFYPLTPVDQGPDDWSGWQCHREDLDSGFVMVFRRARNQQPMHEFHLHEINSRAQYLVSFASGSRSAKEVLMRGARLQRLHLSISGRPGSLLVRYRAVTHSADHVIGQ